MSPYPANRKIQSICKGRSEEAAPIAVAVSAAKAKVHHVHIAQRSHCIGGLGLSMTFRANLSLLDSKEFVRCTLFANKQSQHHRIHFPPGFPVSFGAPVVQTCSEHSLTMTSSPRIKRKTKPLHSESLLHLISKPNPGGEDLGQEHPATRSGMLGVCPPTRILSAAQMK